MTDIELAPPRGSARRLGDGALDFDAGSLRVVAGGRMAIAGNRIIGVAPVNGIFLVSEPTFVSNVFDSDLASQFIRFLAGRGIAHHRVPVRMKISWFGSRDPFSPATWRRCLRVWIHAFFGTVPIPLPGLLPLHEVWFVARLLVWRRQWQATRQILYSLEKVGLLRAFSNSVREVVRRWEIETARSLLQAERHGVCNPWVRKEIACSDRLVVLTMTEFLPDYSFSAATLARML